MLNNPDVGRLFLGLSPDQDETPVSDATDGP
jgi:hypothetical protein